MRTSSQKAVVRSIKDQLEEDLAALAQREGGNKNAHISLLAKWLPSINASSPRTRGQARVLCEALGMSKTEYRRILTKLRAAIGKLDKRMTVFIVSQRTSSIRNADIILVMDDGQIVGKGTHDELMKLCGVYQEIYYSQFPEEKPHGDVINNKRNEEDRTEKNKAAIEKNTEGSGADTSTKGVPV